MDKLDDLYRDIVLDHSTSPRGTQAIERVDASASLFNPACGDRVQLSVQFENGTVSHIQCVSKACSICTASGSILAEAIPQLPTSKARDHIEAIKSMIRERTVPAVLQDTDAASLAGVAEFPNRVRCALLPWTALEQALSSVSFRAEQSGVEKSLKDSHEISPPSLNKVREESK